MTEFKDVVPGIWEAKRDGRDGDYNILVKVYNKVPFLKISIWDYNLCLKGSVMENIGENEIDRLEFGKKIKELEG